MSCYVVIAGDLNTRILVESEIEINENGVCLREFCEYNKLRDTNTL